MKTKAPMDPAWKCRRYGMTACAPRFEFSAENQDEGLVLQMDLRDLRQAWMKLPPCEKRTYIENRIDRLYLRLVNIAKGAFFTDTPRVKRVFAFSFAERDADENRSRENNSQLVNEQQGGSDAAAIRENGAGT